MKILQVTQRYPPSLGGSQLHVQRISEELVKLGHEVTVVSTSSADISDVRGISVEGITLRNRFMDVPRKSIENGVTVYRYPPSLQVLSYLFTPLLFSFLWRHAREYDLVHAHCYMYAEPDTTMVTSSRSGTPFVLTAHDVVTTQGGIIKILKKLYDWTLGRVTLARAKRLIALTEENKRQYSELGCDVGKIELVPNGIDYDTFHGVMRDEKLLARLGNPVHIVLCISRLKEYKGLQYIIDAAPAILERYPDTLFVFVGEDQGYGHELRGRALENETLNNCIFTGAVSSKDVHGYYAVGDVFVLPSIGEGFGLVALEAMSAGIPCVLADHGGLKHVLSEVGGRPLDMEGNVAQQITEHVCSLLKHRPPMEREKQIISEEYSWGAVAQKLDVLYKAVLEENH